MTVRYFLVAIALLACSCGNHTGNAIVIFNTNGTEVQSPILTVDNPQNASAGSPEIFHPRILSLAGPVTTDAENSQASATADNDLQPVQLIRSAPIPEIGPVPSQDKEEPVTEAVKPVVVEVQPAQEGITKNGTTVCIDAPCPEIYCLNHLPAIPSQGICCQRCIFNSKCNASECPKYKCVGEIAPANLTAGECCDHCAAVVTTTTHHTTRAHKTQSHKVSEVTKKTQPHKVSGVTKKTQPHKASEVTKKTQPHKVSELTKKTQPHKASEVTKKTRTTTKHPKKVERSSSEDNSDSSDVGDSLSSSSSSSSTEEYGTKPLECNIRHFRPQHKEHYKSCLIDRLTYPLGHLRHPHPDRRACGCKRSKN